MDIKKAALLALWVACAACFFIHNETLLVLSGRVIFIGLAVIHGIEWLAFRDLLKESEYGQLGNLAGTLLFGLLHIQEVRAEVEGRATEK